MVTLGCSDNIAFGEKVARRFTDRLETGPRALMLVNLHNNEVGREVTYHSCFFFNSYNVAGLCSLSQRTLGRFRAHRHNLRANCSKKVVVMTNHSRRDFNDNSKVIFFMAYRFFEIVPKLTAFATVLIAHANSNIVGRNWRLLMLSHQS